MFFQILANLFYNIFFNIMDPAIDLFSKREEGMIPYGSPMSQVTVAFIEQVRPTFFINQQFAVVVFPNGAFSGVLPACWVASYKTVLLSRESKPKNSFAFRQGSLNPFLFCFLAVKVYRFFTFVARPCSIHK